MTLARNPLANRTGLATLAMAGICLALTGTQADAQQTTAGAATPTPAITCTDIVIPVSGPPASTGITVTIAPLDLINQCTAPAGTTLTLVSHQNGISLVASTTAPQTQTYTVTDNAGHQASAKVTISRK